MHCTVSFGTHAQLSPKPAISLSCVKLLVAITCEEPESSDGSTDNMSCFSTKNCWRYITHIINIRQPIIMQHLAKVLLTDTPYSAIL